LQTLEQEMSILEKPSVHSLLRKTLHAKLAGEKGFCEASISVFADDSVIFTPYAVNGKKFWREARNPLR
jgi:hypothetical protein